MRWGWGSSGVGVRQKRGRRECGVWLTAKRMSGDNPERKKNTKLGSAAIPEDDDHKPRCLKGELAASHSVNGKSRKILTPNRRSGKKKTSGNLPGPLRTKAGVPNRERCHVAEAAGKKSNTKKRRGIVRFLLTKRAKQKKKKEVSKSTAPWPS